MHVSHAHRLPACSRLSLEARLKEVVCWEGDDLVWAQQVWLRKKKKKRDRYVGGGSLSQLSFHLEFRYEDWMFVIFAPLGSSLRDSNLLMSVCAWGWGVGKIRKRI